uniref:Uncharacterized protein n=1 Tax=Vitis vinifera TaxID=29760 RepID=A5ANP3_VITVI|nr:hypothetical protein VITISV_018219 [Vitis vinifera]
MSAEYKVTTGIYTRKYQAKNIWEVSGACVEKQRKFGKVLQLALNSVYMLKESDIYYREAPVGLEAHLPLAPSMSTRCSTARFKKICNRLLDEKLQAIRDLQFGGLLALNCTKVRHNICLFLIQHFNVGFKQIEFSPHEHYVVTTINMTLIFGLPTKERILQETSTSSEHQFGTIRACEEKLLNLPIGKEFR